LVEEGTGVDLSGGQWQKIAIARMFMRQADFLILDEPTASLDAQAEYEIYSHFLNLIRGRTSMLISHRFSTVRIADLIAVLEDGKIVECGTHEELVASGSTYAKLYTLQASQYT
jgi:ATP-binding cassette subfamily B protein